MPKITFNKGMLHKEIFIIQNLKTIFYILITKSSYSLNTKYNILNIL